MRIHGGDSGRDKKKKKMIHVSIRIQQVYFREPEHCPFLRPE